jgi:thiamine-phosphate pyrophosphorylase
MLDKGVLRVVDANFNRSKEGLRVIEDIFRFVWQDDFLRKKIRTLRHRLDILKKEKLIRIAINARDSKQDLGKKIDYLEIKRTDVNSILYANIQRVKESMRVLEEFLKLNSPSHVYRIKKMRYEIYTLEKEIFKLWPPF